MSKKYCYLVKYTWGSHGDYSEIELFATQNFQFAQNYIDKFNTMLDKWSQYYDKLSNKFSDDTSQHIIDRWNQIYEINKAYMNKVELR